MPGASSLAGALAGFCGAPLADFVGAVDTHEQGVEADLAPLIDASLDAGAIPTLADLRARFAPDPDALPQVTVTMAPLSDYDVLTAAPTEGTPA